MNLFVNLPISFVSSVWDRVSELFIKGVCNLCLCDGRFVVKGNSMIFVCVHFFVGKIF